MQVNLEKLLNLCEQNQNFEEISRAVKSLYYRQDYAKYHYQEFKKLSDEKSSPYEVIMTAISLDNDYEKYRKLYKQTLLLACKICILFMIYWGI